MATRLFTRLNDFVLNNTLALKAYINAILDQVEEQYDSIQQNIADITSVEALIDDIGSDGILSRTEKLIVVREVQGFIDEKSGIDTQATALSITTEKTTYDTAYTALFTYLGGLSPAWNDTTQDTPITRATWDSKFNDYYSARQALFNKFDGNASAQSVIIDPFADVIIYADSTGTVKTGQLPKNVSLTASKGNMAVTTAGAWSRTVTSGITCTIGSATGILAISAFTGTDVRVPISFVYGGVTRTATVHVLKQLDPPTSSGGGGATGGTTASTTTLGDTTGTSYDTTNAVSGVLTVTAGTGGQVACSASFAFWRVSGTGSTGAFGKWIWRVPAGVWADITTEVQETDVCSSTSGNIDSEGTITVSHTKTGLTSGSSYEFRFLWRRRNVSGTAADVTYVYGALQATGS
jgi:hypothetical protein